MQSRILPKRFFLSKIRNYWSQGKGNLDNGHDGIMQEMGE